MTSPSLSPPDLYWVYVLFHLPAWERIPQISCSLLNPALSAVFNLVIFSQEFYCSSTSIWLNFTSSSQGFARLIFHYPSSADALEDIGATYFSQVRDVALLQKHRSKTGKICSPFPGKSTMKMSSMGQDVRASVLVIVLIAGHHLQNLNNSYDSAAGAICVRGVIGKKLAELRRIRNVRMRHGAFKTNFVLFSSFSFGPHSDPSSEITFRRSRSVRSVEEEGQQ